MKEKFEVWFRQEHPGLPLDYELPLVEALWDCWQAAFSSDKHTQPTEGLKFPPSHIVNKC